MPEFHRYGIYYLPPPGPLAGFGASWLGWDAQSGQETEHPDLPGLPGPVAEITATPRKYGFHGTIKPPFRLAEGTTADDLNAALATLCGQLTPVTLDGLALSSLGRFLALTPEGDTAQLATLAGRVVRDLDRFRAPAEAAEIERRRSAGLTEEQEHNLLEWGYPYVMDQFRFHMTLTGRLSREDRIATEAALSRVLEPLRPVPFIFDSLCLTGADAAGRFHLISRHALGTT